MYSKFLVLLIASKKTTYQVAKETGISNTTFSDWKRGKSKPKFGKLAIISKYFNVPIEYFADIAEMDVESKEEFTAKAKADNARSTD